MQSRLTTVLAAAICAVAFTGCVNLRYSKYTGRDTSSPYGPWLEGSGTMTETRFAVPIYRGWPEKTYKVLGSLSHEDVNARWNDDFFAAAAAEAKKHGGDAVIMREGAEWGVSKIADLKPSGILGSSGQTTALVIRWLTPEEISDQNRRVVELLKGFFGNDPAVAANQDVGKLVRVYLLNTGLELNSDEFGHQFTDTMTRLVPSVPGSLSGGWIFKGSESVQSGLSGGDEKGFIGLASVSVDGENVAIVSNGGTVEINFTGTLSKNRLNGQLGIGGVSSKCEGAATGEKISISFQSLTSDGTVRGNVVFQRATAK
jgi:hypothetical protein